MKLRNGFVSNSSSSSFIVAAKKGTKLVVNVEMELPVDEVISTKKQLDEWFIERYGYEECPTVEKILQEAPYLNETYKNCVKELKKGNSIFIGSVANDDGDSVSLYLFDNGIGNTLKKGKVIQECKH